MTIRRATKCRARVPANCLDVNCPERRAFFSVPRDHARNDKRETGWYDPRLLLRKEIGDPIPGDFNPDYLPENYWDGDAADGTSLVEEMVLRGLTENKAKQQAEKD